MSDLALLHTLWTLLTVLVGIDVGYTAGLAGLGFRRVALRIACVALASWIGSALLQVGL